MSVDEVSQTKCPQTSCRDTHLLSSMDAVNNLRLQTWQYDCCEWYLVSHVSFVTRWSCKRSRSDCLRSNHSRRKDTRSFPLCPRSSGLFCSPLLTSAERSSISDIFHSRHLLIVLKGTGNSFLTVSLLQCSKSEHFSLSLLSLSLSFSLSFSLCLSLSLSFSVSAVVCLYSVSV